MYTTLPCIKHVYTQASLYPTRVYVLKHLKKLNILNYGRRSRVLPIDYLLVPVAQMFPAVSQLKNYFGRSIKRLQWEGLKRRENRELLYWDYPLIKSEDPRASSTSPSSRNPCFLESWYPFTCVRYPCVGYGRSLLKTRTRWTWRVVPLGVGRGRLRWTLSMFWLYLSAIKETLSCSWYQLFSCIWCYCNGLCMNDYFNV